MNDNVINIQKTFQDLLTDEQDFIRSILDCAIHSGYIYPCDLFGFTSILRYTVPDGMVAHCKIANQWHYGHVDEYQYNFQYDSGNWIWLNKFSANPNIAGLLFIKNDDFYPNGKIEPFSTIIRKYRIRDEHVPIYHFSQKIYQGDSMGHRNIWKDWIDDRYLIQHLMEHTVHEQFTFLEVRMEFENNSGLIYTAETCGDDFDNIWTEASIKIAKDKFYERYHTKCTDDRLTLLSLRQVITLDEDQLEYALRIANGKL